MNKTVGEGINVGKRLRALKEWDQNRIVQPQERKLATAKGCTWKRKSTPTCEIIGSTFGVEGIRLSMGLVQLESASSVWLMKMMQKSLLIIIEKSVG